jgi:hypothetical protein
LDAVRQKTVLRRDETEPARASMRRQVADGLRAARALSTVLAAAELLASQKFESAVRARRQISSRRCQRKRLISACGAKT